MTEADLATLTQRVAAMANKTPAKAAPPRARSMNKEERAYAAHLAQLQAIGEIAAYRYELLKVRLADNTFYTPDFMVTMPDGVIEMHEVKAYWEKAGKVGITDDAAVKIKVAAEITPFRYCLVYRRSGSWVRQPI